MKKSFLILLLLICSFNAFNQTILFNKPISEFGNNPLTQAVSTSIIANDKGYIISGTIFDTLNNNYQTLFFYQLDSLANITKVRKFSKSGINYYYNFSSLIKTYDNGYCYAGDMEDTSSTDINSIHFLIKFDINLDTLWTKIIPHDTILEAIYNIKECSDKGFVMVGSRYNSLINNNILFIKTDSLGNQLWKTTIPVAYIGAASQIIETPDKGFIINGYNNSFTYGQGDCLLIKTDSMGNQQWIKYLDINNNQHDGGGAMALTNDGNILYAYGYATYTYPFNEYKDARLNIIKFSMNGTHLWNKMYDTIRFDLFSNKIQVLPNNDFIVMGSYMEKRNENYYTSYLFKFNANGDSLWKRIYYMKDGFADENALVDNVLNADGGITACGWVSSDTQVPYQQIWILKTDSTGYAPGPQNVGIIDLPYLQVRYGGVKVYPNPANDFVVISYEISKAINGLRLVICNSLGKTVYEKELNKPKDELLITLKDFAKGNYIATLFNNGKVVNSSKIVIQ